MTTNEEIGDLLQRLGVVANAGTLQSHSPIDGDLEYIGEGGLDAGFADEMRWFDHWLKGIDTGIMDEPAMTYYHMGSARKGAISPKNQKRGLVARIPAAIHAASSPATSRPNRKARNSANPLIAALTIANDVGGS